MCDQHFRIVKGRFRIPFLRGPVDRNVKKYETFERRYAADLSAWLSNLYVDIRHLPREFNNEATGRRFDEIDYDFEVDYVNGKVRTLESKSGDGDAAEEGLAGEQEGEVSCGEERGD